jgi:hypothetical protein
MPATATALIATRARPAAQRLSRLVFDAQSVVQIAERQATAARNAAEADALAMVRARLLDVEWAMSEADAAAGEKPEATEKPTDAELTACPDSLRDAPDEVLRTLLAHEMDRLEDDDRGNLTSFTSSAGVGFNEAIEYARGRRLVTRKGKRAHLTLEKAMNLAVALGYRLELTRLK